MRSDIAASITSRAAHRLCDHDQMKRCRSRPHRVMKLGVVQQSARRNKSTRSRRTWKVARFMGYRNVLPFALLAQASFACT